MAKTKPSKKTLNLESLIRERGLSLKAIEQERARLLKQQRLYALRQLRSLAQKTQTEISEAIGVTQNRVSKLERYDLEKLELRTITSYIEALEGKLTIEVEINGQAYRFPVSGQ